MVSIYLCRLSSIPTASVRDAMQLARIYLQPDKQAEREAIAERGREHALRFHRSTNRTDYLFDKLAELR